jgi:hypothetical protein
MAFSIVAPRHLPEASIHHSGNSEASFRSITELTRELYGKPELKGSPECGKYHGAFNNNRYHTLEILKLRDKFNIELAIETGTQFGTTTKLLARTFRWVHTIESNDLTFFHPCGLEMPPHYTFARERLLDDQNVTLHLGASPQILEDILPVLVRKTNSPILFFLDAHNIFPAAGPVGTAALDELEVIAKHCYDNCVVVLDDIYNPDAPHLEYDTYEGVPFCYDYVRNALKRTYSSYIHFYSGRIDHFFQNIPDRDRGGPHRRVNRSHLLVYPSRLAKHARLERLGCVFRGVRERLYHIPRCAVDRTQRFVLRALRWAKRRVRRYVA